MYLCEKNTIQSRCNYEKDFLGLILAVWWLVWSLGLGGNGDLILWLIIGASAKLVSKQKSILVIPLEIYF